ncbi:hypothetical protein Tco_0841274 [Tanacetum coccineum]|uniref:Uncharacterized protein n=1 Tax=Tanacetum coccineum TaxID=301880 RepID=A0ABQ5AY64_9ASTR
MCTSWSSRIQQNAFGVRSGSDFPIHFLYTLASIILSYEFGVSCANFDSSIKVSHGREGYRSGGVVAAAAAVDGVVEGVGGCRRQRWCCMSSVGVSGGVESMAVVVTAV